MQKSNYILVSSCEWLQNFTMFIKKIEHNPYFIQSTIAQYHINSRDTLNLAVTVKTNLIDRV